jgi:hypothetical protein
VRIEVGYGFEGTLTGANMTGRIRWFARET